jgi:sulfoxide reductase heme-binding subunit YedZ
MKRLLAQILVVVLALVPAALIVADLLGDRLGANPIEEITHRTGDWTIRLLLGALAVTPLRRLTGWNGVIRFRRTLGLLAFTYATIHFLTWVVLDQGLFLQGDALGYVLDDVAKRPYITVGFTAFVLLVPLAVTSTRGWVRRLGRRWTPCTAWSMSRRPGNPALPVAGEGEQLAPVWYGLALVALLAVRLRPPRSASVRPISRPRPAPLPASGTPSTHARSRAPPP